MSQQIYQGSQGCGCSKSSPAPSVKNKGECEKPEKKINDCLEPIMGCNLDFHIIAGEDATQKICFLNRWTEVRCLYPQGRITTVDSLCLATTPQKVRLGCVTGCQSTDINTLHDVTTLADVGRDMTLSAPLSISETRCYERQIASAPGCPVELPQPPIVMSHLDPSNWIMEGYISTRKASIRSRKDFGVKVTPGSNRIYFTLDRQVFVGDQVCIFLPTQTFSAQVTRVSCDEIVDACGEIVLATFVELDKVLPGSVQGGSCYLARFDSSPLIDFKFKLTSDQCWEVSLPWQETAKLPVIEYCGEEDHLPTCNDKDAKFLGYWDVFALIPYLEGTQLKTERVRVACGCTFLHGTSSSHYNLC
jgi:hypothetical protein